MLNIDLCMCKDRPLKDCPGEFEPDCDLGNNPKFAEVYDPDKTEVAVELSKAYMRGHDDGWASCLAYIEAGK